MIPIRVEPRSSLRTQRRVAVKLGTAPDGLPMVMSIDRGSSPESILLPIARNLGEGDDPKLWTGNLRQLADQLIRNQDARYFFEAETTDGKTTTYYLCRAELRAMLGATLLERLARESPQRNQSSRPLVTPVAGEPGGTRVNYGTVSQIVDHWESSDTDGVAEEFVRKHEEMSSSKFAIDTGSDHVVIARAPKTPHGKPLVERPFLEESIAYFDTARFKMTHDGDTIAEGKFGAEYMEARSQFPGQHQKWILEMKMRDVMRLAVDLAKEINEAHELGIVHADLKPANVLVGRRGPKPIDSLNVPVGELAPGLTRGYAAPEQVLGEPVGPGTDQYAFAVMICELIGGMLYGKESTFTVPVGHARLERFTLLESPNVYLDSETSRLPREAVRALKVVLERCLRFKPEERFPKIIDAGHAFAELVESHGLFANISAPIRFGEIARFPDNSVAWLLYDRQ